MQIKNRRKISGLVVDSAALVRLSIPFFLLLVISAGTILTIHWMISQALVNANTDGTMDAGTMAVLHNLLSQVTTVGTIGLGLLGMVCIILWIIFSHRIFGPIVPIRRHVGKMMEGDFESRISLRPPDEFKELAADLNALAEKLSAKK